jgi:hypothetical protein
MESFVLHDHGPSPAAQNGAHDDLVMACCIALYMYRLRGHHPNRPRRKQRPGGLLGLGRGKRPDVVDMSRYAA